MLVRTTTIEISDLQVDQNRISTNLFLQHISKLQILTVGEIELVVIDYSLDFSAIVLNRLDNPPMRDLYLWSRFKCVAASIFLDEIVTEVQYDKRRQNACDLSAKLWLAIVLNLEDSGARSAAAGDSQRTTRMIAHVA